MTRWAAVLCSVILAAPAKTATVRLNLHAPDTAENVTAVPGSVTFRPAIGDQAAEPITISVERIPGVSRVDVPPGLYVIDVRVEGWWAPSRVVAIRDNESVDVPLRPTGWVEGSLAGESPRISVRFHDRSDDTVSGESSCEQGPASFRCPVPAGRFDLRIGMSGHVPHYRSNVAIAARKAHSVGALSFVPGASLSGRVKVEEGDARAVRLSVGTISIRPDESGFFSAGPIAPGEYTLTATTKGLIGAPVTVTVLEGHEARLRETLILSKPRSLEVTMAPPTDPLGESWHVRLSQKDVVREGAASMDGSWRAENLLPGSYTLRLRPARGPVWRVEEVSIEDARTAKHLAVETVMVHGTVRFGDKPLQANVAFGGERSPNPLRYKSDERGEFKGFLPVPPEGRWKVTVSSDDPPVSATLTGVEVKQQEDSSTATVEIVVPATGIAGDVVDDKGAPSKRAFVNIAGTASGAALTQVRADENGRFAVFGLAPGTYSVSAEQHLAESLPSVVTISEEDSEPVSVRLQLAAQRKWTGHVRLPDGRPVRGAKISAIAVDVPVSMVPFSQSNAEGEFTVVLPAAARMADIRVAAHGFTFAASRRPVTSDPLEIVVDPRGGSLVLEYQEKPGHEPFIWHGGVPLAGLSLIGEWGARLERSSAGMRTLRVPQLQPGHYRVCLLPAEQFEHTMPVPPSCPSVYLPPFGEAVVQMSAAGR